MDLSLDDLIKVSKTDQKKKPKAKAKAKPKTKRAGVRQLQVHFIVYPSHFIVYGAD